MSVVGIGAINKSDWMQDKEKSVTNSQRTMKKGTGRGNCEADGWQKR
jgi:hypothetical protein